MWKVFSRYIRLRDAIRTTGEPYQIVCITCFRVVDIKNCDAGHFMSRGRKSTLYDEKNVHAQCKSCNGYKAGEQFIYGQKINELYGKGTAEKLELESHQIKQYKTFELEELYDTYKTKLSELESTHGNMW